MPKKILVIRFSSIGDIVLTSPVVRCLHQQLGAEVHFLTKKAFSAIPEANPYIARVWAMEHTLGDLLSDLQREHFDCIIDLHKNLRSWRVKQALRRPSYHFEKLNLEKWLMVNFKWNRLPSVHIVDRYLEAARPLGVVNDGEGLEYFIPEGSAIDAAGFLEAHAQDPAYFRQSYAGQPFCAVVTGAAHATKCLPEDRIIALCRQIQRPVVLLGGKMEMDAGERMARSSGLHVVNACGKCSLHGSASLIQQSTKVFTPDTGMMHIAAALHKPIVSFWGNTIPEFGMYPYYGREVVPHTELQVPGLACRPCSKIGFDHCPKGHFRCMRGISLEGLTGL